MRRLPKACPRQTAGLVLCLLSILISPMAYAGNVSVPFTRATLCDLNSAPDHSEDFAKLHSLCSVWYPGNPILPLAPLTSLGNTPWQRACSILEQRTHGATAADRQLFDSIFSRGEMQSKRRNALCFYSLVDYDNDGLRDFRIASTGRFVENDNDIDNDGVLNILDNNPFRPGDTVPDALPDWLSFRCAVNQRLCTIQRRLFSKFGVAMVNKDFDGASPEFRASVVSTADTIELVFAQGLKNHPNYDAENNRLPSLHTVTFEHCDTLETSPWDEKRDCPESVIDGYVNETEAIAATHNQSFTVYNNSAIRPGFVRLGIFAHELAHSWSFAYDHHTAELRAAMLNENFWTVPKFDEELKAFGWTIPHRPASEVINEIEASGLIISADAEVVEHDVDGYLLDGLPLEVLQDLANAVNLNDPVAKKYGLIGTYALSSPWEWQADAVLAWLYRRMERQILKHTTDRQNARDLRQLFRAHSLEQFEGQFYYPNLRKRVFKRIERQLAMPDAAADRLVCRYIVYDRKFDIFRHPDADGVAGGMTNEINIARVKRAVQRDWKNVCGQG